MIGALLRRLRVRDDGTGKGREQDGTFAEFEAEAAVVLLGDPGMGKTTFFKTAANANYATVRKFLIDPQLPTGEALFLDALDEYRTVASGLDASAEVAKVLCSLGKPQFRLSCRAADWFGSQDQEALRAASASGRVVVLELCPLSHDEIIEAVQGKVLDPEVFLEEAESTGISKLLSNPQTLELLARAWGTGKKPQNKFEVYETGVSELIKEINSQRVVRGVPGPDTGDLRKAAGAAASTLLLSNSIGISRTETATKDGYINFSIVPCANKDDLNAALKRRLFVSSEVDCFEPAHRTIAEFLAAEDLSGRIANGLPIDRVMALLCGIDGRPVSSLRGLFAWLMCKLGSRAEDFVVRDPYGVAAYGDASVMPPSAQHALWEGLRQLHDPWFLASEDDRGSFHGLANPNTAKVMKEILQDLSTGVHLKIAVLEAVANSNASTGLTSILRNLVLEEHDNAWLRRVALRAFFRAVQGNWTQVEELDHELAAAADDLSAPEVRVELLRLTRNFGSLALRLLSALEQGASADKTQYIWGRFHALMDLPSDVDLDEILDGATLLSVAKGEAWLDFHSLFDEWLKRRLESPLPINPVQLYGWLRNILGGRDSRPRSTLALKVKFAQEPALFEAVFDAASSAMLSEERSSWLFAHDLWEILPLNVWNVSPSEFFLARTEKEPDTGRAADFFRMYLSWFPREEITVALAESGFAVLDRRHAVAEALGEWRICEIDTWRKRQWERKKEEGREKAISRAQNIVYLTPRLAAIREGGIEDALSWAAMVYRGIFLDADKSATPRERLIHATNDEIADALIQGFFHYVANPAIPKKEAIIEAWCAQSIPRAHLLLSLSVFFRHCSDTQVPREALPQCIAAVVSGFDAGNKVPGHDETLAAWIVHETRENPFVMRSVLSELWTRGNGTRYLPAFTTLSRDPGSRNFLVSLSCEVLRTNVNINHEAVCELVQFLLSHDQRSALAIGEIQIARSDLSAELMAVWRTVLFIVEPSKFLEPWVSHIVASDAAMWEALRVIGGEGVRLTPAQRATVVAMLGQRFARVETPLGGWSGDQNPWDASRAVANQVKLLAADGSAEADAQLQRLEDDDALLSYRDVIRHERAQLKKQQRESSFVFASPEQVADALDNSAPATPSDLLAFVVDHLGALSREIARTQRERYRAYWNESGYNLARPKREEVCSGLLAEDLQNRVQAHHLIVNVEQHMVSDKECDLMVLQGSERLLPIEVKHHYHKALWTAWRTQLDRLYTRESGAGGLGIYLVLWSGEAKGRRMPKLPKGIRRPTNAIELVGSLESLIPEEDRHRLRIVVVDIAAP